ncbi:restriction endonuclease [Dactylosporangium sp. NPDC051485]|uniref:restriction endonuclease n=1 Tax=Dactylosporangium sp. NPDC051485 TaxID=3154846 RepID=UPI003419E28C
MRFNALLADALVRDGVDADADRRGPNGEVDVAFFLDGTWYLMEAKWYTDPITVEPLRQLRDILTQRRPGTIGILASRSGFDDSARRRAAEVRDVVLFDRPHLEALIGGVATGSELVTAANRSVAVYGQPDVPLAALLRPRRPVRCANSLSALVRHAGVSGCVARMSAMIAGQGTRPASRNEWPRLRRHGVPAGVSRNRQHRSTTTNCR